MKIQILTMYQFFHINDTLPNNKCQRFKYYAILYLIINALTIQILQCITYQCIDINDLFFIILFIYWIYSD